MDGSRRNRIQTLLTVVAAGAGMARWADGRYMMHEGMTWALQAPALVCWAIHIGRARVDGVDLGLMALVAVGGVAVAIARHSVDSFFICTTVFLVGRLLLDYLGSFYLVLDGQMGRPASLARVCIKPWIACVLLLTVLLAMPLATRSSVPDYRHNLWHHVLNCGVTATSTACLVGVSPDSFGEDYSLAGQSFIMMITYFAGMLMSAMGLAFARPFLCREIPLRTVWKTSILLQLAATAAMCSGWHDSDTPTAAARIGWSFVHSASAIWNTGFVMSPDGLADYLRNPVIFTCISTLSIIGSLGVPIILDLLNIGRRGAPPSTLVPDGPWKKLPNWEAATTFILLAGAAVLLFLFETPRFLPDELIPSRPFDLGSRLVPLRDEPDHQDRWRCAVFVSATLRSAGVQSIPVAEGAISTPSYALMLAWMAIGGSAAGVAGGMRTTLIVLVALCMLHTRNAWSQHPRAAELRGRLIRRCATFAAIWLAGAALSVGATFLTTQATLHEWVFDPVAAYSGVGLSTGLALHLTWGARLLIIAAMIAGRWLPVVFWLGVSQMILDVLRPTAKARMAG